jgi:hypothetical protein
MANSLDARKFCEIFTPTCDGCDWFVQVKQLIMHTRNIMVKMIGNGGLVPSFFYGVISAAL